MNFEQLEQLRYLFNDDILMNRRIAKVADNIFGPKVRTFINFVSVGRRFESLSCTNVQERIIGKKVNEGFF